MFKNMISMTLVVCILFQLGCASTRRVPVFRSEYDSLQKAKIIYVTLKNHQTLKLINFTITDTHITGTSMPRTGDWKTVEINLEDVELIEAERSEITGSDVVKSVFIGIGVATLIVVIACLIAADSQ
jgi:hypothetical protein